MLCNTRHPFKDVFITQPTFACADNVEPFFYNLGVRAICGLSDKLCCFCAKGESDEPDEELQKMFTTVLRVYSACLSKGAKIIVMHAIRNSSQRASRVAIQVQRKAKRDARARPLRRFIRTKRTYRRALLRKPLRCPMRRWR